MRLLRDKVLIRPFWYRKVGSLLILREEKSPTIGEVVEVGPKVLEIEPGDIVVWAPVSIDVPNAYFPYFYISLKDEDGTEDFVLLEAGKESVLAIERAMRSYHANPSTADRWLTVVDVNSNDNVRFKTSNVQDYGQAELSPNGRLKTNYVAALRFDIWNGAEAVTHYLMREADILCKVNVED